MALGRGGVRLFGEPQTAEVDVTISGLVVGAPIEANDTDVTLTAARNFLIFTNLTANHTVNLPALASVPDGTLFIVKDLSNDLGFTITIDADAGETIDLALTYAMGSGFMEAIFICKTATKGWVIL